MAESAVFRNVRLDIPAAAGVDGDRAPSPSRLELLDVDTGLARGMPPGAGAGRVSSSMPGPAATTARTELREIRPAGDEGRAGPPTGFSVTRLPG